MTRKPWQLQMFDKSLKKRQKMELLVPMLEPLQDRRCLLITAGDNTGGMNHYLRAAGGRWVWAELGRDGLREMARFLGEPVQRVQPDGLPFRPGTFERIVIIDVHEHLPEVRAFNLELARVLAPGGRIVVTTPNGDPRLPVARLKRWLGMDDAAYGHVVQGYEAGTIRSMLEDAGLIPEQQGAYSRFFTECIELALNFVYVKILARKGGERAVPEGVIAPNSEERLRAVGKSYRLYSLAYPLIKAFTSLDALVPGEGGYAVAVAARKPAR